MVLQLASAGLQYLETMVAEEVFRIEVVIAPRSVTVQLQELICLVLVERSGVQVLLMV